MITAVAYLRVSTDRQDTDMQRAVIMEQAEKDKVKIIEWYEDDAISGAFIERRNDLKRMIFDAEKKLFNLVYFYKLDRAFRNLEEQIPVLNRLNKLGVKYSAVRDPETGTGASGRLLENLLGAVNQFERELTAERVFDKHRTMAKEGRWTGGRPPLGYSYDEETKTLSIDESEAWMIRKIFATYERVHSIADTMEIMLNDPNPRSGKPLDSRAVRDILGNPHYCGQISFGRRKKLPGAKWATSSREFEVFDGQHEGIISPDQFARVQEIKEFNAVKTRRRTNAFYLLSGLLECSHCGKNVVGCPRGQNPKGYSVQYYCPTKNRRGSAFCNGWHRSTPYIDRVVIREIMANIKRAKLASFTPITPPQEDNRKDIILKKLQAIDNKLARQLEAYEAEVITLVELKHRREEALKEQAQLKKELAKQPAAPSVSITLLESFAQFETIWETADNPSQQSIVRSLIDKIITNGLDMEIHFKDFPLDGWQKVVRAEAEETSKFNRSRM